MARDELKEKVQKFVNDLPSEFDGDLFDDDGPDVEFKVATIRPQITTPDPGFADIDPKGGALWSPDEWLEEMLNDGWQIEGHIACPPLVTYILSREKGE